MDRLLISVLGNEDSGKSFTWNALFGATVKTGKKERRLYLSRNEYVKVFLVSGSPEERERYVGELIAVHNPRIVFCSTQYCEEVKATFNYFLERDYFLFVHWLNPGYSDSDKPYFDYLGLVNWLLSKQSLTGIRSGNVDARARVEEIREYIYGWAKARNLLIGH